jgi:hypothetical protein
MRNILATVVEKIKTHILRSLTFFPKIRVVCELMWKNMVQRWTVQRWRHKMAQERYNLEAGQLRQKAEP